MVGKRVLLGLSVLLCLLFGTCSLGTDIETLRGRLSKDKTYTVIEMVYVPGGTFEMGSVRGHSDERPVHTVTLSGFYMGKYEITQAQYQAVMGNNPSRFSSDPASGEVQRNRPVEYVTWYDAVEFCNKLSIKEGLQRVYTISGRSPSTGYPIVSATVTADWGKNGYRLPTEAEWEYAAKGGNGSPGNYTYSGSNTVDDVAWYYGHSSIMTHEVGKKSLNGLGIYDMSGNVWEWCWDWYGDYKSETLSNPVGAATGSSRVIRGGSWDSDANLTRSANRGYTFTLSWDYDLGFRLVRPSDTVSSFSVSFESNGGSNVSTQIVNSGGTVTRPANPTKSGYTFDNWYSNSGLTTVYNFSTAVTGNITLYAKWNPVSATPNEMVYVPSSSFEMGKDLETVAIGDVTPVHTVTLNSFYMGKYQVTQAQYQAVMGTNPSYFRSSSASGDVQENRPLVRPLERYGHAMVPVTVYIEVYFL